MFAVSWLVMVMIPRLTEKENAEIAMENIQQYCTVYN